MAQVGPVEVEVPGTAAAVFAAFTDELGAWWPPPYSWGPDALADHRLEGRVGGRVTEVTDDGLELDWARVTAWEPPTRVVLDWLIGGDRVPTPDTARRSRLTVSFEEQPRGGTRVRVVHDRLEAHGDGDGSAYAEGLGSPQGWPWILEQFAAHLQ